MNVAIRQENCVSGVDLNTHVSELVNQLFNRLCAYCNRWRYNYPTDEALEEAFQHTATRRRLHIKLDAGGKPDYVSTHSHPKAAA